MPKLAAMIQTTWSNIRVCLYRHEDGRFQYLEEGLNGEGTEVKYQVSESRMYNDFETAKADMIQFYCEQVEDEYVVDPSSVVVLEPPDFKGPHHPPLRLRFPEDGK